MTLIDTKAKQEIVGGWGPMMWWVAITGVSLGINAISDLVGKFLGTNDASSSKSNSAYLRVSPFPNRSAFMMGI